MKVVVGVCGIGSGHTYRQLPLIDELAQHHQVALTTYGTSLAVLTERYRTHPNVDVHQVVVPYLPGTRTGLDFAGAAQQADPSTLAQNYQVMETLTQTLGAPDLVVSDYEPVAASYGYAHNAPVVTLDQQSKYLLAACPEELGGTTPLDERMRLRMFFPQAAKRLACSFFHLPTRGEGVELVPPVLRAGTRELTPTPHDDEVVVYRTRRDGNPQTPSELASVLGQFPRTRFTVVTEETWEEVPANVVPVRHGVDLPQLLARSGGVITTAGHSLVSEAVALRVPSHLTPIALYEQQLSAKVVSEAGFGVSAPEVSTESLGEFLGKLPRYRRALQDDQEVLLRGDGLGAVLAHLEEVTPGIRV